MSDSFFEPTGGLDHFREEEREQTERDELTHDRELDQRYDHAEEEADAQEWLRFRSRWFPW